MKLTRTSFLRSMVLGSFGFSVSSFKNNFEEKIPNWTFESLFKQIAEPIVIRSIELIKTQGQLVL